jgi:hypothetical protein
MISGIYGMNIGLPFQDYPGAFIVLIGFMVIMAVFTVLIFKKKKRL